VVHKLASRIGGSSALLATQTAANTVRGVSLVIGTASSRLCYPASASRWPGSAPRQSWGCSASFSAAVQIGTGIIWIPTAAWLAHIDESGWAAFTAIWGITINVMDTFIKPYFIGLSSPLPFLLIMVGVVGGLLAWGFVGIFLGTTLLAVAHTTFAWLSAPVAEK
jgi:hypothetical protein